MVGPMDRTISTMLTLSSMTTGHMAYANQQQMLLTCGSHSAIFSTHLRFSRQWVSFLQLASYLIYARALLEYVMSCHLRQGGVPEGAVH